MAQPTEVYVDPSINGDSGTGTSGDPYGDLEYGIEQTTFDTTNGTRMNIKAGTDEVIVGDISTAMADTATTAAWVPSTAAPAVFQGYTTAAGDNGKCGLDGNGSRLFLNKSNTHFIDCVMHNGGSNTLVTLQSTCSLIRCELHTTTGYGVTIGNDFYVMGCYFHNIAQRGFSMSNVGNGYVGFNYFLNETNDFDEAIFLLDGLVVCERNIIKVDGTSDGISVSGQAVVRNNSIWSNGGTGQGIVITSGSEEVWDISNNLVEGFSGTGGIGYDLDDSGATLRVYSGNASYDNATHYADPGDWTLDDWKGTGNETLSASPFTDATNADFSPVDTGAVKEGSVPADFGDGQ